MFKLAEITTEDLTKLKAELSGDGCQITSPNTASAQFTINGHGVVATCLYDETTNTVTVKLEKKPFFVTEKHIEDVLLEKLNGVEPKAKIEEFEEIPEEN